MMRGSFHSAYSPSLTRIHQLLRFPFGLHMKISFGVILANRAHCTWQTSPNHGSLLRATVLLQSQRLYRTSSDIQIYQISGGLYISNRIVTRKAKVEPGLLKQFQSYFHASCSSLIFTSHGALGHDEQIITKTKSKRVPTRFDIKKKKEISSRPIKNRKRGELIMVHESYQQTPSDAIVKQSSWKAHCDKYLLRLSTHEAGLSSTA